MPDVDNNKKMASFFIGFYISAIGVLLTIKLRNRYFATLDSDLANTWKVHLKPVPRIGGIGIFAAVLLTGCHTIWPMRVSNISNMSNMSNMSNIFLGHVG